MTFFAEATDGSRRRADADAALLEQVPPAARDQDSLSRIHYWVSPIVNGTALDGALWALGWSLSTVFGDTLGALLEEATLSNVEEWNGTTWVPVA